MSTTNFPNGVQTSFVVAPGLISSLGQVFFVNNGVPVKNGVVGQDGLGNNGSSPQQPFSSVQRAVDACVSGRGDVVYVMGSSSGYAENIVVTKDFVSIIGIPSGGYARPDIVPAAGIALSSTAQGLVVQHMRFASLLVDCVLHEGNGYIYNDCVFDGDGTAAKAGVRLKGNATDDSYTASEGIIQNSLFRGCAFGLLFDTAEPAVGVGETDVTVTGNKFITNTIDIATADTGPGTYSIQHGQIGPGNIFADKNKTCYIDLTTSNGGAASDQTGVINGNFFAADAITAGNEVRMVGTGFTFPGNFNTVGVKDGSGLD